MIEILRDNPVLLLFVVAAIGYFLGTLKIRGQSLGVSAILFTGLFFGAIDPNIHVPGIILSLGLSIFVYSIGLNSGPAFFNSYQKNGLRDFLFVVVMMLLSGAISIGLWALFGFSAAVIAGVYAGSTTNTAAMAGVIDMIKNTYDEEAASVLVEDIVVGYSFSYPMGVLGGIIAIILVERMLRIDYKAEQESLRKEYPQNQGIGSRTIRITNDQVCNRQLRDLVKAYEWNVVFGRIYQNNQVGLANWGTRFQVGNHVRVTGNKEDLDQITDLFGEEGDNSLTDDGNFDYRTIFVSNPQVAGRRIASLNIFEGYDAVITRLRRGDIDMLATSDTVLELGDRIRFVARREDLDRLSTYFGDSYHQSSKINLFTFGLGIGLGLILGTVEFSLGGDVSFRLGYAGGPLVVGLLLGALRHTGPINWTLPYSANVTLQQLGLILFLSAIGVRSGNAFIQSLSIEGVWMFMASVVISLLTALSILILGLKLMKIPFTLLMGMVANQPAILDFAMERAKNRIPVFGYSLMFPIAVILKIVIAQLIFILLR